MLGPIGSDLMSIFRLLSPDEIDRYIEHHKARKIEGTMAANGEELSFDEHEPDLSGHQKQKKKFPKDHKAEIIPLDELRGKTKRNEKDQSAEVQSSADSDLDEAVPEQVQSHRTTQNPKRNSELESMGILSAATMRDIEQKRLEKEAKNKDSTTAFLIKERNKMRSSKKRLIEQHAFKSYQTNAAQEFYETEMDEEDDDVNVSNKGILVNKKHY